MFNWYLDHMNEIHWSTVLLSPVHLSRSSIWKKKDWCLSQMASKLVLLKSWFESLFLHDHKSTLNRSSKAFRGQGTKLFLLDTSNWKNYYPFNTNYTSHSNIQKRVEYFKISGFVGIKSVSTILYLPNSQLKFIWFSGTFQR